MIPAFVPPSPTAIRRPALLTSDSAPNIASSCRWWSSLIFEAPPLRKTNASACFRTSVASADNCAFCSGDELDASMIRGSRVVVCAVVVGANTLQSAAVNMSVVVRL